MSIFAHHRHWFLVAGFGALLAAVVLSGCDEEESAAPTGALASVAALEASSALLHPGDSVQVRARVMANGVAQAGVAVRFAEVRPVALGTFVPSEGLTDSLGWAGALYVPSVLDSGAVDLKAIAGESVAYLTVLVSPSPPAASGRVVTLSAAETALPADGVSQLTVTVRVTEDGLGVGGQTVVLTAGEYFADLDADGIFSEGDQLLLDADEDGVWDAQGSISSPVVTDAGGAASAVYTAGFSPGDVYIKATADTVAVDLELQLYAEQAQVAVTATPDEAWADGFSTLEVTAELVDEEQAPVTGKLVRFTAGEAFQDQDGDGYFTPGVDLYTDQNENGSWDRMGAIASAVTSGVDGRAHATLTAGRLAGVATIYASTGEGGATTSVRLHALPRVTSADWSWTPASLYADGISTAELAVTVYDINGNPIPGKQVSLEASAGSVASQAFADAAGTVHASLQAPEEPGELTVVVTSESWSVSVPFTIDPLPTVVGLTLSAEPALLALRGASGDWAQLTAGATGSDGLALPAGVPIDFVLESGPGGGEGLGAEALGTARVMTDGVGEARTVLRAGTVAGDVTVLATANGVERRLGLEIVAEAEVRHVALQAVPAMLTVRGVGGADQSMLAASCELALGLPAAGGVPVTFELLAGPGGDPGTEVGEGGGSCVVLTDAAGVAHTTLRSGTLPGPVTVRASAGSASQTLYLGVSAGPPVGLFCWADTTTLGFLGETDIHAAVHDAYHNPVPDRAVVVFAADAGLIYTAEGGASATTLAGQARATFIAPPESEEAPALVTIHCQTDGAGGASIADTTYLALPTAVEPLPPGPIAHLAMQLSTSEIEVRATGGQEQCQVQVAAYDASQQPVGPGREIAFSILAGPGGGEALSGGGWGPVSVLTDDLGQASVTLESGTISGTVEIEARSGEQASQSAMVSVVAGPPAFISVGVDPLNVRGWDVVGADAAITAYVSDSYHNPVREGTVVYFTCDEGIVRGNYMVQGDLASSTTEGGVGVATYFSGLPREDGRVTITVTTAGGTVIGSCGLLSSGPPATVTFLTAPPLLLADGVSKVDLWVEVLDVNGNFVVGGTPVDFRAPLGTLNETQITADGVYGSVASTTLLSATLTQDHSWSVPDDGIGALVPVTASAGLAGAASDVLQVTLATGSAYRGNSSIEISSSVSAGTTVPFEVQVKDRYGNPLGGHQLQLTVSGGGAVTPVDTTDAWGTAAQVLFTAPAADTSCVMTVVDTDPDYGGMTLSTTITVQ